MLNLKKKLIRKVNPNNSLPSALYTPLKEDSDGRFEAQAPDLLIFVVLIKNKYPIRNYAPVLLGIWYLFLL